MGSCMCYVDPLIPGVASKYHLIALLAMLLKVPTQKHSRSPFEGVYEAENVENFQASGLHRIAWQTLYIRNELCSCRSCQSRFEVHVSQITQRTRLMNPRPCAQTSKSPKRPKTTGTEEIFLLPRDKYTLL